MLLQVYFLTEIKTTTSSSSLFVLVSTSTSEPELEASIDRFLNNAEIDLEGKQIADHSMEVICKKAVNEKQCSKLRLQKNKFTGKGAATLANALGNNTTLLELYLSKNSISDTGVHAIAQTLAVNNCTLKVLDLYSNKITDEGVEYLSEMLKVNRTIMRLGLGDNQIGNQGVQVLAQTMIHFNSTLQWLSLSTNRLITDKSLPILKELFTSQCSLRAFWLNGCSLSNDAAEQLQEQVKKLGEFNLEI